LESAAELSVSERARLANLKSELENINKKKEEYVKEHPEHRKLVYRARRQNDEKKKEPVAPPGMPYMERRESFHAIHRSIFSDLPALRPDEIDSDEEDLGTFVD
jgi:hypothetical protein